MRHLIVMAAILAPAAFGAANQWRNVGPEGGPIFWILTDPRTSNIYTAGSGGTFQSSDGGLRWVATHFPAGRVTLDPRDSGTLYVANGSHGYFKSTDSGANWMLMPSGLPEWSSVLEVKITPSRPDTWYASVGLASGDTQVFRSVDGGKTWSSRGPAMSGCCGPMVLDLQDPDTLYMAVEPDDYSPVMLYRSTDGAATWIWLSAIDDMAPYLDGPWIDPSAPSTLYAPVCKPGKQFCTPGIVKSTDRGESWSDASVGLDTSVAYYTLTPDPMRANTLYASSPDTGLYQSVDGAASWTKISPDGKAMVLTADPRIPGMLYAGGYAGFSRSADGGATWTFIQSGLTTSTVFGLEVDPSGNLYVISSGSLKSADGGASWQPLELMPSVLSLIVDAFAPDTLYAAVRPQPGSASILKSTDGGNNWIAAGSGIDGQVNLLTVDPSNSGTLYSVNLNGIYQTTNGAATWQLMGPGPKDGFIERLVVDPTNSRTLYGISYSCCPAIWKSTDAGATFRAVTGGLPSVLVRAFTVDPRDGTLYVEAFYGGNFQSRDGGETWQDGPAGLPGSVVINSLVADAEHHFVYAGTTAGVYRSLDGGNWTPMNDGLTSPVVNRLVLERRNSGTLYAGTSGGGVFAISLSEPDSRQIGAGRGPRHGR
jgi:photosystem II stability/assembly factor-like uncharacterized protein